MTEQDAILSVRRLYWLTGSFGAIGFVSYFWLQGTRPAFAFALGTLGSFGNLWLFNWLTRAIAPGDAMRKPWQAGAFIGRYLVFFLLGYVIVKSLGVNPLPVILGLLASTAAVLASTVIELLQSLFLSRSSH
jgi:hypothetical protein